MDDEWMMDDAWMMDDEWMMMNDFVYVFLNLMEKNPLSTIHTSPGRRRDLGFSSRDRDSTRRVHRG